MEIAEVSVTLAEMLDATFILDVIAARNDEDLQSVPGPKFLRWLYTPIVMARRKERGKVLFERADAISLGHRIGLQGMGISGLPEMPIHVCYDGVYVDEFPRPRLQRFDDQHAAPSSLPVTAGEGKSGRVTTSVSPTLHAPLVCAVWVDSGARYVADTLGQLVASLSAEGRAASIHVVGGGSRESTLRRIVAESSGSCRLVYHEPLSRPDYLEVLSQCHVGLLFDDFAGEPRLIGAVSDCAAAGLAIVYVGFGEIAEMIEKHCAGMTCKPQQARAVLSEVRDLARSSADLNAKRQAAREMAEDVFDREKTFKLFADWIETVAGGV